MVLALTLNQSIRLVNHLLAAARTKTLTCPATKLSSTCLVQFDNATGISSVSPQHRPYTFQYKLEILQMMVDDTWRTATRGLDLKRRHAMRCRLLLKLKPQCVSITTSFPCSMSSTSFWPRTEIRLRLCKLGQSRPIHERLGESKTMEGGAKGGPEVTFGPDSQLHMLGPRITDQQGFNTNWRWVRVLLYWFLLADGSSFEIDWTTEFALGTPGISWASIAHLGYMPPRFRWHFNHRYRPLSTKRQFKTPEMYVIDLV